MSEVEQSFADYKAARFAPPQEEITESDPPVQEGKVTEAEPAPVEPKAEKQPNPKLEKRFSELTAKRDAALQEAAKERAEREKIEARLRELEGGKPAAQTQEAEKPKREAYEDHDAYVEALAAHKAQEVVQQREAQARELSTQQATEKAWNDRLAEARKELPDLDDTVASADVSITGIMAQAMKESEVGPHILYHLAENPELAEKITQMSPLDQARAMGRLEAKLAKTEAPQAQISKAPPPITPLKGSKGGNESYEDAKGEFTGTHAQYKALRRAGKIK